MEMLFGARATDLNNCLCLPLFDGLLKLLLINCRRRSAGSRRPEMGRGSFLGLGDCAMRRIAIVGAITLFVGGCAVPVPLQIASWVIDGVSYLATEKSVADHGISMVAQQDCAIWRGVTDGKVCRIDADDSVAIALAEAQPPVGTQDDAASVTALAKFETAAGGDADVVNNQPVLPQLPPRAALTESIEIAAIDDNLLEAAPAVVDPAPASAAAVVRPMVEARPNVVMPIATAAPVVKPVPVRAPRRAVSTRPGEPLPGRYLVLASFRFSGNARVLRNKLDGLGAEVLAARIGNKTVYRVAIGPYAPSVEGTLRQRLLKVGYSTPWAIHVRPGEWTLSASADAPIGSVEVAGAR